MHLVQRIVLSPRRVGQQKAQPQHQGARCRIPNTPKLRRLPLGALRRLGCVLIPGHLRLKAILARLTRGLASRHCHRFVNRSTILLRLLKPAHDVTGIQSSLCARPLASATARGIRGANPTVSTGSKTIRMASIYPFRAWRYNPSAVKLDDVVTQPYDKISPAMQQAYYQRSPYNLVRIILGLPELFDAERGESVYYPRGARFPRLARARHSGAGKRSLHLCLLAALQGSRLRRSQGTARLYRPGQAARLRRTGGLSPRIHAFQAQERPSQSAEGDARPLRPDLHALLRPRRQRGKDSLRQATAPPKPRSPTNTAFCIACGGSATRRPSAC